MGSILVIKPAQSLDLLCHQLFTKVQIGFIEIQTAPHNISLPKDFVETLHSHEIFRLKSKYNSGKNLVFGIQHYYSKKSNPYRDGGFKRTVGENIQAQFLAKILKEIFPEADIVNGEPTNYKLWQAYNPGKKLLLINIVDSGETENKSSPKYGPQISSRSRIQMQNLKSVNPGLSKVPHHAFRKVLRISKSHYIVSLYMHPNSGSGPEASEFPSSAQVIREIEKIKTPNIVILSHTGTRAFLDLYSLRTDLPDYTLFPLSQFNRVQIDPKLKYIFYNDTLGKMPIVYNISDITFVSGPVNIFESINSGTPVLFMNTQAAIGDYSKTVFDSMANIAKSSGGGFPLTKVDQVSSVLKKILENPPTITKPYQLSFADSVQDSYTYELLTWIQFAIDNASREFDKQTAPIEPQPNSSQGNHDIWQNRYY